MNFVTCACVILFFLSVGPLCVHGVEVDLGKPCSSLNTGEGICACSSGYVQNRTVEYTKQECVPTVVQTKNYGENCSWGQCMGDFVCKNGQCACPFYHPAYNGQTKACESSGRGEPCLICSGTNTHGPCHLGTGRDAEGLLWTVTIGFGCKPKTGLYCYDDINLNLNLNLNLIPSSKCFCDRSSGQFVNYHEPSKTCEKAYEGGDCGSHVDCHPDRELLCLNGKCKCSHRAPVWEAEFRTCRRYLHGEQCETDFQCEEGLKCGNEICECAPGFSALDNRTRTCKKAFGDPCKGLLVRECVHLGNVDCVNFVCACPESYQEYNGTWCVKTKLEAGEKCFENGVLGHDLCGSGHCVGEETNQVDLEGRCACPSKNGVTHFYLPNANNGRPGCYPDHDGRPCRSDLGCFPSGLGQDRLVCKNVEFGYEQLCACDKANHIYFLGRCVEADRTYGDSCDPYGVSQSTCKIDPAIALVCREDSPGNGKCECRKMGMNSTDGKMIFVDLSWNATAQKCELEMKKDGMMCKANGECQSGECDPSGSAAKCAPMPSAGIQIQSAKIVIIIISMFSMLK